MSRKSFKAIDATFVPDVEREMAFLVDEFELIGPEVSHHVLTTIAYTDGTRRIRIGHDDSEMYVNVELRCAQPRSSIRPVHALRKAGAREYDL